MKWKTKTGEILDVKDMTDSHIANCIKMVERQLARLDDGQVYTGDSDLAEQWVEMENEKAREMISSGKRIVQCFKQELKYREIGWRPEIIRVCDSCGKVDITNEHECMPNWEQEQNLFYK